MRVSSGRESGPQDGLLLAQAAALLLVFGAFLAALAPWLSQTRRSDARNEEKARVRAARDEVIGYAVRTCRLPNPNAPDSWAPSHDQGRRKGERIVYLPHADLLGVDLKPKPSGGYVLTRGGAALATGDRVAFFVLGQGANRRTDLDVAAAPVLLPAASEAFDDTVEYATLDYLASLALRNCAAGETYLQGGGATLPSIASEAGYKGAKYADRYLNPWSLVNLATGTVSSLSPHDGGAVARLGYNGRSAGVWEQGLLLVSGTSTAHLTWTAGQVKSFVAQYDGAANRITLHVDAQVLSSTLPAVPDGCARVLGNFYVIAYARQGGETVSVSGLAVDGTVLDSPYDALSANGTSSLYSYTLSQREQAASSLRVSGQVALSDARAPANDADTGVSAHFLLYDVSPIVLTSISPSTGAGGASVTLEGASFPLSNPSVFFEDATSGLRLSATILAATEGRIVCLAPAFGAGASTRVFVKGAQRYEYSNVVYFTYN
jgi:hypothetical protein